MTNYISYLAFKYGLDERLHRDEEGATAVEYGIMVALIAVAIILTVTALGLELDTLFGGVADSLEGANEDAEFGEG